MPKSLTKIQSKIFEFILEHRTLMGMPPTLAEIASKFGYKNRATVQQHIGAIEKKGFLKRSPKISRGLSPTVEDKFFIPRPVLGEVAAGSPLVMYPDAIDSVQLPSIAKTPSQSFILKVKGDSLKDAYIFSGDFVIVNPNSSPKNGDIVVAVLDDSAVVKRFFAKRGTIELISENPDYKPIIIEKEKLQFNLVGVVVGIYRKMERKVA
jgi:repressor LexA